MDEVAARLPPSPPQVEMPGMMKLAIVGRPNVGKSMLLNAILGWQRVIVDDAPGTTRDAVDTVFSYDGQSVLLIDTAGIRRRGRVEGGERYSVMRALRAIARADIALLVADASEGITAQDTHIAGYVWEAFKGMVLVMNKWDLVQGEHRDIAWQSAEIRSRLRFLPEIPIQFISAKLGQGIEGVLAAAQEVYGERQKRVPTAELNESIARILAAHGPPSVRGRQLKLRYGTQVEVNPPIFVFFVNDARLLRPTYQRYLENRLRREFGFRGTPLRLVFRSRE